MTGTTNRATVEGLTSIRDALLDQSYASLGNRRTSSVHEFYRYPARFPARFASAAIRAFTEPGDIVMDPFLGGGTTVIEAMRLGREAFGSDINELALFVARAKTHQYSDESLRVLRSWANSVSDQVKLNKSVSTAPFWTDNGYLKHLDNAATWRIRQAIELSLSSIGILNDAGAELLARCAVLRTAQMELDARRQPGGVESFRSSLAANAIGMADRAEEFRMELGSHRTQQNATIVEQALPGLSDHPHRPSRPPRLIVTSPPYPGVYVLYHRWKVGGRLESAAPYWIAGARDGHGQAHYTMGARSDQHRNRYFRELKAAFADLATMCDERTWLVQIVGFNDIPNQFDRYLDVMSQSGLEEVRFDELATETDGRLWREVPGRRWWVAANALKGVAPSTSREVVLVHQLAR